MLKTVSSIANAIGALNYVGTWNASTNTPALASGVGTKGDYYVVSVAGSTALDGLSNWGVGDWAVFSGTAWQRVEGGADGNFVNLSTTGNTTLGDASTDTLNVGNGDIVKDASGNTGFGTASPAGKVDVRTANGATVIAGRVNNVGVGSEAGYFETRAPNGTGTARIWSQIKTLIGNATAGTEANSLVFSTQSAGAFAEDCRIDPNRYLLVGYTTSNGAYRLQVNGQIFATSATIATSDAKYKENVQDLSGALDIVSALRPVQFNWKQHPTHKFNTDAPTVGFLAQEVQQVLADKPYLSSIVKSSVCEVVPAEYKETTITNEAGEEVVQVEIIKPAVTEDFLGIAEGNMIAILTKAIQELKAEFDAYKASHP